jgi:hypothetical protein
MISLSLMFSLELFTVLWHFSLALTGKLGLISLTVSSSHCLSDYKAWIQHDICFIFISLWCLTETRQDSFSPLELFTVLWYVPLALAGEAGIEFSYCFIESLFI